MRRSGSRARGITRSRAKPPNSDVLRTVETDIYRAVHLHERVMPSQDRPWVHHTCAADHVCATRLVDMAAEDEIRLLALDKAPNNGAAHMLAAGEPIARGSARRRMRTEDPQAAILDVGERRLESPLELVGRTKRRSGRA